MYAFPSYSLTVLQVFDEDEDCMLLITIFGFQNFDVSTVLSCQKHNYIVSVILTLP